MLVSHGDCKPRVLIGLAIYVLQRHKRHPTRPGTSGHFDVSERAKQRAALDTRDQTEDCLRFRGAPGDAAAGAGNSSSAKIHQITDNDGLRQHHRQERFTTAADRNRILDWSRC